MDNGGEMVMAEGDGGGCDELGEGGHHCRCITVVASLDLDHGNRKTRGIGTRGMRGAC